MMDMEFIDQLYKQYYAQADRAVKAIGQVEFPHGNPVRKIAIYYSKLGAGGIEKVISLLTPMYLQLGYEVCVLAEHISAETDYEFPESVEKLKIPSKEECCRRGDYKIRGEAIRKIIKNKQIDTVIYHEATSAILLYDLLTYKNEGVNFILVKHEIFSQYMVNRADFLYQQIHIFPLADKVLVLGNTEKKFWQYMGIDTEYIFNPVKKRIVSRQENGEHIIVWSGRLVQCHKQYLDLIPIMSEVVKKVPDALLKIYGSEFDQGAVEQLNEMIVSSNLEKNIIYCGYIRDDAEDIYAQASVHLVTSAFESFSMVIYESKVSGVPLVLYKMPYLEILKDKEGYIEVDNDDIKEAAGAVVDILLNPELKAKLSAEAKKSAEVFSNEQLKRRWKEIFDAVSEEKVSVDMGAVRREPDIEVILNMFVYHYHKGVLYGQEANAQRLKHESIKAKLQIAIQHKNLPIVLYPYGKLGKEVKRILNDEFHEQEAFVVDNYCVDDTITVRRVEELSDVDCSKYLFLICSNKKEYYQEIRDEIKKYVPDENIVDLWAVRRYI